MIINSRPLCGKGWLIVGLFVVAPLSLGIGRTPSEKEDGDALSLPKSKKVDVVKPLKGIQFTSEARARRLRGDKKIGSVMARGRKVVAVYRDRVEFFELAEDVIVDPRGNLKVGRKVGAPSEFEPLRVAWFECPTDVLSYDSSDNLLVCANVSAGRLASDGIGDFCGIISIAGDVVYQFPIEQRPPDKLLRPLAISRDGLYAEVYIGRLVQGADSATVGAPIEVLAWRYPNHLTRFAGPWKNSTPNDPARAYDSLLQGFKEREKVR